MARAPISHQLSAVIFQLSLIALVRAQLNSSFSYSNLSEAFPAIQDLYTPSLDRTRFIGGQNLTRCCLLAVNASYQVVNGHVIQTTDPDDDFIDLTPDELSEAQFPCGATYNGSDAGAPLVTIPYLWCQGHCSGWEQSTNRFLAQWLQPFVGFILPAAVFCLNVPRKSALAISDNLFPSRFEELSKKFKDLNPLRKRQDEENSRTFIEYVSSMIYFGCFLALVVLEAAIRGSLAASIALADTIIWVGVVFSTAGPMVLSGLYEATIDRKVIEAIHKKKLRGEDQDNPRLYKKIYLLYAVLVGNLIDPTDSYEPHSEIRSAWGDVKRLVEPLKAFPSRLTEGEKKVLETRLKGMLECQASFGAAIGAPVVFFLGSFLFSVFSNLSTVGDNDTAHALAFGMWWMIIPHVAVISGCLLAGNNPNTLEVIMCGVLHPWDPDSPSKGSMPWWRHLNLYRPSYKSVYQPVWMWERGRSKRNWLRRVQKEAPLGEQFEDEKTPEQSPNSQSPQYGDQFYFKLHTWDWIFLIIIALSLMAIPIVLAFLTSFYTPTIGLSCRSFTFLLYFLFQFWLSIIWLLDFSRDIRHPLTRDITWPSGKTIIVPSFYCVVTVFGLTGAAFTGIGGTFMQILGVYRNCKCSIPMSAWSSGDYSIVISSNSADQIRYAKTFWLPTGITSIVVLILVCYVGWWYQRHWRSRFDRLIEELLRGKPNASPPSILKEKKESTVAEVTVTEHKNADEITPNPPNPLNPLN